MSDVRCPRCGESFRIPETDIPAGAIARCPWCAEPFPISQLLSTLPPMAELISEDGTAISLPQTHGSTAFAFAGPSEDEPRAASDPFRLADETDSQVDDIGDLLDEEAEFSGDVDELTEEVGGPLSEAEYLSDESSELPDDAEPLSDEHAEASPLRWESDELDPQLDYETPVEPRPLQEVSETTFEHHPRAFVTRPKSKRKSSPLRSVLGIVGGGLLALPLAAIILALLGKPLDIGFWPFDGETIALGAVARTAAPAMRVERSDRPLTPPRPGRSLGEDLSDPFAGATAAETDVSDLELDHQSLEPLAREATPSVTPRSADAGASAEAAVSPADDAFPLDSAVAEPAPAADSPAFVPGSPGQESGDSLRSEETALDQAGPAADLPSQPEPAPPVAEPPVAETSATESPVAEPLAATSPVAEMPAAESPVAVEPLVTESPIVETPVTVERGAELLAMASPAEETAAPVEATPSPGELDDERSEDSQTVSVTPGQPAVETVAEVNPSPQRQHPSPQLQTALSSATEAVDAVENYDNADGTAGLKRRLAALYAAIAATGELAQPEDDREVAAVVDRLLVNNLVNDLAPAAPNWTKYSKRPNDGMFAVGVLRRENESWFLDWAGATPLEIRSPNQATAHEGRRVLVLGRIVSSDLSAPAIEATWVKPTE